MPPALRTAIGRRHTSFALATLAVALTIAVLAGCSTTKESTSSTSTTANRQGAVTTTPPPPPVLWNGQGGNLDAYETEAPFDHQQVVTSHSADPKGVDVNGQICFFPDGSRRFVAAVGDGDVASGGTGGTGGTGGNGGTGGTTGTTATSGTTQAPGSTQQPGWGIFQLTGDSVGNYQARLVTRLTPTYQPSTDDPTPYGCGILSDGRIVTTDVGNRAGGEGTGQLVIWFPAADPTQISSCKLDTGIATALGVWVDDRDRVYVASARAPSAGVLRYSGPFPTSADAKGGCSKRDPTGAPLADSAKRETFIAAGDHGMTSPSAIAAGPENTLYVSSVNSGVIDEYDRSGRFLRTILEPPPTGTTAGTPTFPSGSPLGIVVGPDGTLYYADVGLVSGASGPTPESGTGSLRRITFDASGNPSIPENVAGKLDAPDGVGMLVPAGGGGAASVA